LNNLEIINRKPFMFKQATEPTSERRGRTTKGAVIALIAASALTGCAVNTVSAESPTPSATKTAETNVLTSAEFAINANQDPTKIGGDFVDMLNKLRHIPYTPEEQAAYIANSENSTTLSAAMKPFAQKNAETAADGILVKDWRSNTELKDFVDNTLEPFAETSLVQEIATDPKYSPQNSEGFVAKQLVDSVTVNPGSDSKTLNETISVHFTSNYKNNDAIKVDPGLVDLEGHPATITVSFDLSSGSALASSATIG